MNEILTHDESTMTFIEQKQRKYFMSRSIWIATVEMIIFIFMNFISSEVNAVTKNDLVTRFAEMLKFRATGLENQNSTSDTKITPLFVRSAEANEIDLTMLIVYDKNISKAVQKITSNKVTPLIFSVSTMPFVETRFDPVLFCFEQERIKWSPKKGENVSDIFPLGENSVFGGDIDDNQVQQGVILLPGYFDLNKPIKITYKQFKKVFEFK